MYLGIISALFLSSLLGGNHNDAHAEIDICTKDSSVHGIHECSQVDPVDNLLMNDPSTTKTGANLMRDSLMYRGSSTPLEERDSLKIRGLIPAAVIPLELQIQRSMEQFRSKVSPLEKYIYLQSIQDVDERLYYAMLVSHTAEVMPIVYTPTVGEACMKFSAIYRGTMRGLYISLNDLGSVRSVLDNWPASNVTTIVVTDGERILGLGDLGVNGMGIPIGKLALYTACAGIHPSNVLPVHIDTGTDNEANLNDPYYLGLRRRRERGAAYDALIAEFFRAAQDKFGRTVLIQFEDFGNLNAFRLLERFREEATTFNDDIQGTAAVALAGIIVSCRLTGKRISDYTYMFAGAGEAGTGIAELIAYAVSIEKSISISEARKRIYLVDSTGLVTKGRIDTLQHHKVNFAHDVSLSGNDLLSAIQLIKPSVLVGVSAVAKMFNRTVIETMTNLNDRPVIFALSNPTSKAECTATEAYEWSEGRAIYSSGSPFDPVTLPDGRRFVPGQGNNAYVFPGVGLGALAVGSTKITDHDMLIAAEALASLVSDDDVKVGSLYPPLSRLREVSSHIAARIAKNAYDRGYATKPLPPTSDLHSYIKSLMYNPLEDK